MLLVNALLRFRHVVMPKESDRTGLGTKLVRGQLQVQVGGIHVQGIRIVVVTAGEQAGL